jgi:hypothetical protein
MRILIGASIAAVVVAATALPARAATEIRYQNAQGGVVCQLSIPTLDTTVRAKATGFRNEGTTSSFAICGMESSNSRDGYGTIQALTMALYSLNGVSSNVSCTAVNGFANAAPKYSTKVVSTTTDGTPALLTFDATDFGGVAGDPLPDSDFWSITCNLPGMTSIGYLSTQFTVNAPGN